jgi:hypothetical protein
MEMEIYVKLGWSSALCDDIANCHGNIQCYHIAHSKIHCSSLLIEMLALRSFALRQTGDCI